MDKMSKKGGTADKKYTVKAKPGKLLFDHYRKTIGLDSKTGYDEMTLCATEDGEKLLLGVFRKEPGEAEQSSGYLVSANALSQVMAAVKKYKMHRWSRKKPVGEGELTLCKFIRLGKLVGVSSENMPESGNEAFCEIYVILTKYIDEKNRVNFVD